MIFPICFPTVILKFFTVEMILDLGQLPIGLFILFIIVFAILLDNHDT